MSASACWVLAASNQIGGIVAGQGNVIANNGAGRHPDPGATSGPEQIRGNAIFDNDALGIDVGAAGDVHGDP